MKAGFEKYLEKVIIAANEKQQKYEEDIMRNQ